MALQPYFRERYLKNHTMMTVVDQSPNLFGLGSVLEVVNESESLKEHIVAAAGGRGPVIGAPMGWGNVVENVEALYGAARVVQTLGRQIKSIVRDGVQSLIVKRGH